eukprot:4253182-Pyramimonas_sp.AAC.2
MFLSMHVVWRPSCASSGARPPRPEGGVPSDTARRSPCWVWKAVLQPTPCQRVRGGHAQNLTSASSAV